MKGKLGTGKHLDETMLQKPDGGVASGGKIPVAPTPPTPTPGSANGGGTWFDTGVTTGANTSANPGSNTHSNGVTTPAGTATPSGNGADLTNLFSGGKPVAAKQQRTANPTSGLNLLGQVESWGVGPATPLTNVAIKITKMTGAQLQKLLRDLPDGVTYGLDLEKETN